MTSLSVPFRFDGGKVASTTDNSTIAKQKIIDVLATRNMERVMRPEHGAGISDLLFEPMDPLVFADYKIDALQTVNESVSNALVRDMILDNNAVQYNGNGESTLVVRVVYDVAGEGTTVFTLTFDGTRILTEETPI
jgi:phage baseplate assembly protein W